VCFSKTTSLSSPKDDILLDSLDLSPCARIRGPCMQHCWAPLHKCGNTQTIHGHVLTCTVPKLFIRFTIAHLSLSCRSSSRRRKDSTSRMNNTTHPRGNKRVAFEHRRETTVRVGMLGRTESVEKNVIKFNKMVEKQIPHTR
jgi:hypothetical protein